MSDIKNETVEYYNLHAREYADETLATDLSDIIDQFLGYLPNPEKCGEILELGCGAGRDAKVMFSRGYTVDMTDGSIELCKIACEYTGHVARQMMFDELDEECRYDGIWACGSLLHVPKANLPDILAKCQRALKPGGVMFMCFKVGNFDGLRSGRHYSDLDQEEIERLVLNMGQMEILDMYMTGDTMPDRPSFNWLNVFVCKN